jgi:hypothetical protein
VTELGLFADDPDNPGDEILYCVANAGANGNYLPAEGETPVEMTFALAVLVAGATTVTATINNSLVYVTHDELDDILLDFVTESELATALAPITARDGVHVIDLSAADGDRTITLTEEQYQAGAVVLTGDADGNVTIAIPDTMAKATLFIDNQADPNNIYVKKGAGGGTVQIGWSTKTVGTALIWLTGAAAPQRAWITEPQTI